MKITAKQYAVSLIEALEDKGKEETKAIIGQFVKVMASNNDLAKADTVIKEFFNLWDEQSGLATVSVDSSRKLSASSRKNIEEYVKNRLGVSNVDIEENVEEKILGGVIIRYRDKILDGSLATILNDIKQIMKK